MSYQYSIWALEIFVIVYSVGWAINYRRKKIFENTFYGKNKVEFWAIVVVILISTGWLSRLFLEILTYSGPGAPTLPAI